MFYGLPNYTKYLSMKLFVRLLGAFTYDGQGRYPNEEYEA